MARASPATLLDPGLRRNGDPGDSWDSEVLSKQRNILFVPIRCEESTT